MFYIPSLTLHCCWELDGPVKSTTLTAVAYGSISVVDMDTESGKVTGFTHPPLVKIKLNYPECGTVPSYHKFVLHPETNGDVLLSF